MYDMCMNKIRMNFDRKKCLLTAMLSFCLNRASTKDFMKVYHSSCEFSLHTHS